MMTYGEIMGIIYMQVTGVGFLWNCVILFLNIYNFLITHRTKPKNLIITHLAFSNAIFLLFGGIPSATRILRVKCLLEELGIRIITYWQIIGRGLSLDSTCLLSAFQAITISPNNSRWAQLKIRAPKCITQCILLFWVFNLLLNVMIFFLQINPPNSTDSKYGCNTGYRILDINNENYVKLRIFAFVHDSLFLCFMTCSSVYMVIILYRHKRHVNHIHNNSRSIKISTETRATQAIVLLVSTFVLFNVFSPIFMLYMSYFKYSVTWIIQTSVFLSLGYPTLSPFLLISVDKQIPRFVLCKELKFRV
ncbi:vomeronasal type-1 receptor 1-like [Gracilinanus agilis]|uniref:vomeronasal type-1 receptor 1-like n=1 Tax=Gracilinanus agilis TaxID=191870 RepID=UPI001CFE2F84|nr:vomeronasal type-1 receptor 1-like [Gracilinanus agilis]